VNKPVGAVYDRALFLLCSVVLTMSILSACNAGPNYRRPVVPAPPVFRGSDGSTAPVDVSSLGDLKWFEVFKDEQLQELIRTALVQNHDVQEAAARVDAARANLGITRADQVPNIDATTDVTTVRLSNQGAFPFPAAVRPDRTFGSAALSLLSFEVDLWGRLRRATEAARADLLASEQSRRAVFTTLVSDTAAAYFDLLGLDAQLEIARRTLATRQESLRLITVRNQGGIATDLDLRQAEQLVYGASATIPEIERQIEQTENRISLLVGANPGPITRGRPLAQQEQPPSVPAGLPSSLLERRPDIRAAEQNLIAANAIIGVARAAYFPSVTLTGFFGFTSNELSNLFSRGTRVWEFVPQVSQPIFAGGRIKSNVKLAEAEQQIALAQYERTIQTAFREVSDALVDHRKVKEVRAQLEMLVKTLQERSRLAYVRYEGGVDTLLNALDADRDLFTAELTLTLTSRDELVALVQLYKALGGGWQQ